MRDRGRVAVGSTRLFQRTGSPLIQGSSRSVRPWWHAVSGALVAGVTLPLIVWWYASVSKGLTLGGAVFDALGTWVEHSPGIVPGTVVGAVIGVVVAGAWGARRRWIAGATLAIAGSFAGVWLMGVVAG